MDRKWHSIGRPRRSRLALIIAVAFGGTALSATALITSSTDRQIVSAVEGTGFGQIGGKIIQATLTNLVLAGNNDAALDQAFDHGDEMFSVGFNAAEAAAPTSAGGRFTRMPRADLTAPAVGATHALARHGPERPSLYRLPPPGPGDDGGASAATTCTAIHSHRRANRMIQRNTPQVMGLGAHAAAGRRDDGGPADHS